MASLHARFGPRNIDDAATEQIIVGTVRRTPTASSEAGLRPGTPFSDPDNLSQGVRIEIRGHYRQGREYPGPTLRIKIEQPGTVRAAALSANVQNIIDAALGDGTAEIDDIIGEVAAQTQRRARSGVVDRQIPRVSVKRSNDDGSSDPDFLGVRTNFEQWPNTATALDALPDGESGVWTWRDAAPMVELDGAFWLVGLTSEGTLADGVLRFFRYDPLQEQYWSEQLTSDHIHDITEPSVNEWPQAVAPFVIGKQLYVLVSVQRASDPRGSFYVLRKRGNSLVLVGEGINSQRDLIDGGIAACAHPGGDGCIVAFGTRREAASPFKRDVSVAVSSDMQTWARDSTTTALHLPTFSNFKTVRMGPATGRGQIRSVKKSVGFAGRDTSSTGAFGFAVDLDGRIYVTKNGGQTWSEQDSPATAQNNKPSSWRQQLAAGSASVDTTKRGKALRLFAVAAYTNGDGTYSGVAVGEHGLILHTVNSGSTWRVLRYGASRPLTNLWESAQIHATAEAATDIDDANLYGVYMGANNTFWVCGSGGRVYYTANTDGTTSTFATVQKIAGSRGAYLDIVADSNNSVICVGDAAVHDVAATDAVKQTTRIALIQGAVDTTPTSVTLYAPTVEGDTAPFVAVVHANAAVFTDSGSRSYAVTRDGRVRRSTTTWLDEIANLGPGEFYDIDSPADADVVLVAGDHEVTGGQLWRSDDAQATISTVDPVAPAFVAQGFEQEGHAIPLSIWYFSNEGSGAIACFDRFILSAEPVENRALPFLRTLQSGSVALSCSNVSTGNIEVYIASAPGIGEIPRFIRVHTWPRFTAEDVAPESMDATIPRSSITEDHLGHIVVACEDSAIVSYDGGRTFVTRQDSRLPIEVGSIVTTAEFTADQHAKSRSIGAFGNMRLFSTCISVDGTKLGTFVGRDWDVNSPAPFLPVFPGRPFWTGLDTAQATIVGKPEPGDTWTVEPKPLYPVTNILKPSPRSVWRSVTKPAAEIETPEETITITAADGSLLDVSAFALFGAKFRQVELATSLYGYPLEFTTKMLEGSVDTGFAAALSASSYSVIRDTAKTGADAWRPHIFAPRPNLTYYVTINDVEGDLRVYRVIDNSHDCLMLDGEAITVTPPIPPQASTAYILWCDVHVWDGVGGTNNWGSDPLNTTPYRYCRTVRIRIPTQPTVDGYFEIGTAIIGVTVDLAVPTGETDRVQAYSPSWTHQIVPNTAEELSLDGVSNVEHFSQLQRFNLTLEAAPYWQREKLLAALTRAERMRDAFALVLDPNRPADTKLVRLLDGPTQRSVGVDDAQIDLPLVEVV